MKKLLFSAALVLSLGLAGCGEDTTKEEPDKELKEAFEKEKEKEESAQKESKEKEKEVVVDMTVANDTSVPLEERITKIATDLFGATTTDGSDRNITVESMGDMYYLKMMIDDGITKKNTLDYAQRNTVKLLEVLKGVGDMGNSNVGSAMTVLLKKTDIDKIDFANFKASNLKDVATNYGTHNDLK